MFSRLRKSLTRSPALPPPASFDLPVKGHVLHVLVNVNARTKRIGLRIQSSTGKVILTFPPHVPFEKAKAFTQSQAEWIWEKYNNIPQKIAFGDGSQFPLRGKLCTIRCTGTLRGVIRLSEETPPSGNQAGLFLNVPGDNAHCARKVMAFLKKEARHDLEQASQHYAAKIGVPLGRIGIKDTRSRWGSCSSRGDLSFSFRLIFAPPFVLDYVAAHEVAHRREMNHSDRFWSLLHSMTPHVDAAELWLKQQGQTLHRYG